MAQISITNVLSRRRNFRILTIFACLVLVGILGRMVITQGSKIGHAVAGDTVDNPYVVTTDGFIYLDEDSHTHYCEAGVGSMYYNRVSMTTTSGAFQLLGTCTGDDIDLSNAYVTIKSGTIVTWNSLAFRGLTIEQAARVTHAPLIRRTTVLGAAYDHANDTAEYGITPGYIEAFGTKEVDWDIATGDVLASGSIKRVDIKVTEFFRIEDGATIDVSGRGFASGTNVAYYGTNTSMSNGAFGAFGAWGDYATTPNYYGWGGGGNGASSVSATTGTGGAGRTYNKPTVATPTYNYASTTANTYNYGGSGGLACFSNNDSCAAAGSGGGYVNIDASTPNAKFILFSTANILANGLRGTTTSTNWLVGGAGGGGKIDITADVYQTYTDLSVPPVVAGGTARAIIPAADMDFPGLIGSLTLPTGLNIAATIQANGGSDGVSIWGGYVGSGGGAGGGGTVNITFANTAKPLADANIPLCEITKESGLDYIPASCENRDVVIDGDGQDMTNATTVRTVYADKVAVWQANLASERTQCNGTEDSLIANWKMESLANTYNAAGDYTNFMMRNFSVESDPSGKVGKAAAFDISNPMMMYENSPPAALSALDSQDGDYSISMWVKSSGLTQKGVLLSRYWENTPQPYYLSCDNATCTFSLGQSNGNIGSVAVNAVWDGVWHNIVVVVDNVANSANSNLNMYWDTQKVVSAYWSNNSTWNPGFTKIGGNYMESNKSFKGSIDEVKIYNKALSDDEVNTVFSRVSYACDTKRIFNSLKLQNNALVSHQALVIADMDQDMDQNGSLANDDAIPAQRKKVEITSYGDLTISTGSKIDVSGKGYPGGYSDQKGYGQGGGMGTNCVGTCGDQWAGGAGYGGAGANNIVPFGQPYNTDNRVFDFGSGGGGAHAHSNNGLFNNHKDIYATGGSGGGRVKLVVYGKLTISSAFSDVISDGMNGTLNDGGVSDVENLHAYSGGGAGGMINLSASQYLLPPNLLPAKISGGVSGGQNGIAKTDIYLPEIFSIIGGNGGASQGNSGAGGRLIVKYINTDFTPNIQKTLTPIMRGGSGNAFDPYSLQSGDRIKVTLRLSNIQSTTMIKDTWLREASSECAPVDGTVSLNPDGYRQGETPYADPLQWTIQAQALPSDETIINYDCVVN